MFCVLKNSNHSSSSSSAASGLIEIPEDCGVHEPDFLNSTIFRLGSCKICLLNPASSASSFTCSAVNSVFSAVTSFFLDAASDLNQ